LQRVVRAGIIDTVVSVHGTPLWVVEFVPMNALATALLKPKSFPLPIGKS
jgi:hypothetical protein